MERRVLRDRYGRWQVIGEMFRENRMSKVLCRCDCGTEKLVMTQKLATGESTSCGCYRNERRKGFHLKHGGADTRLYSVWGNIRARCNKPDNPRYSYYGGRGIRVCSEWAADFAVFREWAMRNGYVEGLQIERIDNDGNYEPSNCRWATRREQCQNRRTTRLLTAFGETKPLIEWSRDPRCVTSWSGLCKRLAVGVPVEQALTVKRFPSKGKNALRSLYGPRKPGSS